MATIGDLKTWIALAQTLDSMSDDTEVVLDVDDHGYKVPLSAGSQEIDGTWKMVISTEEEV